MAQEPLKLVWEARHLEFDLVNQRYKIGRGNHNEIQIPDQLVSSNHAVIQNGCIIDRTSTNGTFINGEPVEKNVKRILKAGDVIMFGDTSIRVERGTPYDSTVPSTVNTNVSSADDDSDSDDEDSVPPMVKRADENPISWHPNLSPANKINGAQSIHHAADTAAAASFGMMTAKGLAEASQNQQRSANAAKLQMERKQKEKERKLELQVEELKHQLLYGLEQSSDRKEQLLLMEAQKELEQVKAQAEHSEKELNSTRQRVKTLEELKKSVEAQISLLLGHYDKVQSKLDQHFDRLASMPFENKDHKSSSSSSNQDDRQQILKALRILSATQVNFAKKTERSTRHLTYYLILCICGLLAVTFFTLFKDTIMKSLNHT